MKPEAPLNSIQHFVKGGGETGKLIAQKDWKLTPVGDFSSWPQNLKTTLSNLLLSKFPMFLFWGPELIQFYNDAYRPSLGDQGKHPEALGERAEDSWKEIWPDIHPIIDNVMKGGEAIWQEDQLVPIHRNGKLEEVYWTYSYSPVKDDKGNINGVLVVCIETTKKIQTAKRLEVIDKKFRNTVKQAPIGIAILRNSNYVVELANEAYLNLTNRLEHEIVGKPILEALPEVKDTVEDLLHNVMQTGNPYRGDEVKVPLKRFGRQEDGYFNFVYHPLKDEAGQTNGIMVVVSDVTQLVLNKFALLETEKQFRNLVTQSPIPMAILRGEDFVIELANEVMYTNLWHKKPQEVIGKKLLDVFPELTNQKFPKLLQQVFEEGVPHKETEAEALLSTPDGIRKHYLDFEYAPLKEFDGKVSGLMMTVLDVTEKVEARQVVKDTAERLQLATEGAHIATWDLDLSSTQIIYSGKLPTLLGYPEHHVMTHQELREHIHPEDIHAIVEKAYDHAMTTGLYHYEARVVQPDGSFRWIKTMGKTFFDEEKKPYRMLGTIMNITERKRYEQELEISEKKFRTLADSMTQLIWTGDPDGIINYFSQSFYNYTGLSISNMKEINWLDIVHSDEREENLKRWMESIHTGNSFLFEHRLLRHDGEYRWHMSRAIPQKDEYGKIIMWVGTSTDTHDRKLFIDKLEENVRERTEQLSKLNQALQKSNDDLAQFAYVASHDLQEPLRKIQTFTTRILEIENENLSEKGKDSFARIQSSSKRMQQLILDLLSYSRVNTGTHLFESVSLKIILDRVLDNMKEPLEQNKAIINTAELPKVLLIPFQFEQLLTNLISNALKFSKAEIAPVITIKAEAVLRKKDEYSDEAPQYYHHISFADNGIGFEPQFKERIFQVFQRLHGKEEYEGTGIGLSIVKKIVDNHHGFIIAESQLGMGTTFHIYIPFAQ